MKKIAIVTSTRAEYGLLSPIIKVLREFESIEFKADLIVTGTHLKETFGKTIDEIEIDNVRIDHIVDISVNSETALDISKNQAEALLKFTELFVEEKYVGVVLLGDRYEMLSIAIAAGNTQTPIFHISGGDTTEGAIDEWIRHSITKMAYFHFPSNEESRKRIIQLGESPDRVFNYGSTSVDNIITQATMGKKEALESIGLKLCRYALCTYHPVTMERNTVDNQIEQFVNAIRSYPEIEFIVTKSNADQGGERINKLLDEAGERVSNMHIFSSLGVKRYLSLMHYAEFVLGNSSSGIIETPVFKVPTVNIGDRQKGRLQVGSIINCDTDVKSIVYAIKKALTPEWKKQCESVVCPYGDGTAAQKIAEKIYNTVLNIDINLKKKFYDVM